MDKSKIGGENSSALVSTASLRRKLDTLLKQRTLQQSEPESKKLMHILETDATHFVVKLEDTSLSVGKSHSRMLTKSEIENLRRTKQRVADRTIFTLTRA